MSWWRNAKVGDKVTQVYDGLWNDVTALRVYRDQSWCPQVGEVYTIKAMATDDDLECGIGLWFGHYSPDTGKRAFFSADDFRPVQTRSSETGMAILRSIADGTTRVPERADAEPAPVSK